MEVIIDEDLERLYSCSLWSKRLNSEDVLAEYDKKCSEGSDEARRKISDHLVCDYSHNGRMQRYYLFGSSLPPGSPVFVFLHGGYWQYGSADLSNFCALPLYEAGIVSVTLGYDLAPTVSVEEIVNQVTSGINHVIHTVEKYRFGDIWLAGHSAGAHLSLMYIVSEKDENAIKKVKGLLLYSGIYDIRPLCNTTTNVALKLTPEAAEDLSPMLKIQSFVGRVAKDFQCLIAVAENDSPAFKTQARQLQEKLEKNEIRTRFTEVEGVDHFDLITNMSQGAYRLSEETKNFIEDSRNGSNSNGSHH